MPRHEISDRKTKDPSTQAELDSRTEEFNKLAGTSPMQEAMFAIGLTPQLLAGKLMLELDAEVNKTQYDGQIGRWVIAPPQIAWEVRQRARQDAAKYWGALRTADEGDDSPLVVEIRGVSRSDSGHEE